MDAHPTKPVVLVLASGRGERFLASGGTTHKLKALLAGEPVLSRTLAAVRESGLDFHVEDAGHAGMGDSIAAAVRATRDAGAWLVLPGDLPLVRPETLLQVVGAINEPAVAVVMPQYQGKRGHPVAFSASCADALMALIGDQGASSIVKQQAEKGALRILDVDDVGAVTDIDTIFDLAQAEAVFRLQFNGQKKV